MPAVFPIPQSRPAERPSRLRRALPLAALALLLPLLAPGTSAAQTVVYVNQSAPGPTHDGTSWATAHLTVGAGLTAAVSGNEVWVAAGMYVEQITLKENVALYGGFAGTETTRNQRNWTLNKTILDGNASWRVVTAPSWATATTRIDGFAIRNGVAPSGGGIYCYNSSPSITNVVITNCRASANGGGISCTVNSSPTLSNVTIADCIASSCGGGIYSNSSSSIFSSITIKRNSADAGGGIYLNSEWRKDKP
jgi:hypothetical protein